ncbi:MAG: primosomal protein N' [Coriobacteriia bacterium]|nr:primosomal protein N' [Coriobacteriia bacterium]
MSVARVILDIPTRQLDKPFDYDVPVGLGNVQVGSCVLVDFGHRPAIGYVVGLAEVSAHEQLLPIKAVMGEPFFRDHGVWLSEWMAKEYVAPLAETVRLFLPPGATPRIVRGRETGAQWVLKAAEVGPVDDRWVVRTPERNGFVPKRGATLQRAVLDALSEGPVRAAELVANLGSCDGALKRLQEAGAVGIEYRRRVRSAGGVRRAAPRHSNLSDGQKLALETIEGAVSQGVGEVILLDGVTGSGKTEVYLRAIESAIACGGCACVLVPEISLTPQTVGRFRSRFGEDIAVLHSRLSSGERYDQWDRVREGSAHVVIGARSAIFAPFNNLRLIVIDEEHEPSYKQGSSPRYHAREVAAKLASLTGAPLVLGSATPSMEAQRRCQDGEWTRVHMPERVTGRDLPAVCVVDMSAEFAAGHRSMFSRPLAEALHGVAARGEKAVLFLNRRGFASFLLCRECGFVPTCETCSTSLTYHEVGSKLVCHHCGISQSVPPVCPRCASPYLRQFGAGTQRVEAELAALLPDLPRVRMDADTTKGKGGHERALAEFESLESGVLLGTQMIAKGLDYPDVTLVGVINADTTLHMPDFRAAERTYQLLEQVAGRAGRGVRPGLVVIQTYWPDHPAIAAVAAHDPEIVYVPERELRRELSYPPYSRLANVMIWGEDAAQVSECAHEIAARLRETAPEAWLILGPSPAPIARLKGVWRWHAMVKAPLGDDLPGLVGDVLHQVRRRSDVSVVTDIDPVDML